MNKKRLLGYKFSLITAMFLGIMILGLGLISLGIFKIWPWSDYPIINDANVVLAKVVEINVEEPNYYEEIIEEDVTVNEPLYPDYPREGDNIGSLIIPTLDLELPIFQGTSNKELKKGVGHFIQSVLPGEVDNSVLSGHRETVFRKLGDLEIGDLLIVETSAGTFTYQVSGTRIVDKDDKTVIVPTEEAVLTVTTCYPFNFVGSAPDRYIVSANLLE